MNTGYAYRGYWLEAGAFLGDPVEISTPMGGWLSDAPTYPEAQAVVDGWLDPR